MKTKLFILLSFVCLGSILIAQENPVWYIQFAESTGLAVNEEEVITSNKPIGKNADGYYTFISFSKDKLGNPCIKLHLVDEGDNIVGSSEKYLYDKSNETDVVGQYIYYSEYFIIQTEFGIDLKIKKTIWDSTKMKDLKYSPVVLLTIMHFKKY